MLFIIDIVENIEYYSPKFLSDYSGRSEHSFV